MKITHLLFIPSLFLFVPAAIILKLPMKKEKKIAVVTVDTVKKKAINIIDTIDYNKRMQALSNNDTTGRWPVKWLIRYQAHYYPIIESSTEIYIHKDGNLRRRAEMIKKLQGEAKWQAADSPAILLYIILQ
jgi:hypothetical protein